MKHGLAFLLAFGGVLACGSAAAADVYTPGSEAGLPVSVVHIDPVAGQARSRS